MVCVSGVVGGQVVVPEIRSSEFCGVSWRINGLVVKGVLEDLSKGLRVEAVRLKWGLSPTFMQSILDANKEVLKGIGFEDVPRVRGAGGWFG